MSSNGLRHLQTKTQQIHHTHFFPALKAQIVDILNANVPEKNIRLFCCGAYIHNVNLRFIKFPETFLAGFHVLSPSMALTAARPLAVDDWLTVPLRATFSNSTSGVVTRTTCASEGTPLEPTAKIIQ